MSRRIALTVWIGLLPLQNGPRIILGPPYFIQTYV